VQHHELGVRGFRLAGRRHRHAAGNPFGFVGGDVERVADLVCRDDGRDLFS
jgi:hypothetical protein